MWRCQGAPVAKWAQLCGWAADMQMCAGHVCADAAGRPLPQRGWRVPAVGHPLTAPASSGPIRAPRSLRHSIVTTVPGGTTWGRWRGWVSGPTAATRALQCRGGARLSGDHSASAPAPSAMVAAARRAAPALAWTLSSGRSASITVRASRAGVPMSSGHSDLAASASVMRAAPAGWPHDSGSSYEQGACSRRRANAVGRRLAASALARISPFPHRKARRRQLPPTPECLRCRTAAQRRRHRHIHADAHARPHAHTSALAARRQRSARSTSRSATPHSRRLPAWRGRPAPWYRALAWPGRVPDALGQSPGRRNGTPGWRDTAVKARTSERVWCVNDAHTRLRYRAATETPHYEIASRQSPCVAAPGGNPGPTILVQILCVLTVICSNENLSLPWQIVSDCDATSCVPAAMMMHAACRDAS